MNPHTVLWIYIVLLVIGGLIGFLKANSRVSLIMSVAFAAALSLCAAGVVFQPYVADLLLERARPPGIREAALRVHTFDGPCERLEPQRCSERRGGPVRQGPARRPRQCGERPDDHERSVGRPHERRMNVGMPHVNVRPACAGRSRRHGPSG